MTPDTTTLRGRVVTGEEVIEDGTVVLTGDRISWVGPTSRWTGDPAPQSDSIILPGLVDLHCHGGAGASFPDSAGADLSTAVEHHRSHGTTTMLASLVSAPPDRLIGQTSLLADLYEAGDIAGVHIEGPFLSVARCGAQDPGSLRSGDPGLLADIIGAGRGAVRSMTLAPEVDGFAAVANMLRENDIVPSIGHTDADALTTRRGIDTLGSGPITATHLFNGMRPLHHRDPGPIAACLAAAARGELVVELVADGTHLADGTVRAVFDLVGPGSIALVTDAMAAAGMPDGAYRLGPMEVTVAGGVARIADETGAIAGGVAHLLDVVRNVVAAGIPLEDAVLAAATTPADVLGRRDLGALAAGRRADLVLVDDDLRPQRVLRGGAWL